jgi:hypothetical protein
MNVLETLAPMLREVNGVLSLCVDGSALSEIHRCPRAAYYKLIRKRVSAKEDKSLSFGKVCAVAWDWRYRHYGNKALHGVNDQAWQDQVIDRAYRELEPENGTLDGSNPCPLCVPSDPLAGAGIEDQGKKAYLHAGRCKDVMRLYNENYGEEPFEVVATERSFETALGVVTFGGRTIIGNVPPTTLPVIWEGRYDMVVRNEYGDWIWDSKTSGYWNTNEGDPWKEWRNSSALKGYCFHRWQESRTLPLGWIIQAAIVRPPLQCENKNSLPRNQFERQEFPLAGEQVLLEWQRNTLVTIQMWVRMAEDGFWPMHDRGGFTCKFCSYLQICTANDDATRDLLLDSSSYKINNWSPQTEVSAK